MGNDGPCKIVRKGNIQLRLPNKNTWLLKYVRHVPDLRRNLISTGQLGVEGCTTTFTDKVWKVTKGSLVIAKRDKVGTLYLCNGIVDFSISLAYTGVDTVM